MVQFVKPNLLGKYNEYLNRFVNPITNGQYVDSTPYDIQMMKRRSHILHKLLDGCVQRRDYAVLAPYLPVKHEYVVYVQLTELQIELYKVKGEPIDDILVFILQLVRFPTVLHGAPANHGRVEADQVIGVVLGLPKFATYLDASTCASLQQRSV